MGRKSEFLSDNRILYDPVFHVEESIRALSVELPEIFEFLHGLRVPIVIDEGHKMQIIFSTLVHYYLVFSEKLQRALVEVKNLFQKLSIEEINEV